MEMRGMRKVEGGKLLRCRMRVSEGVILELQITGDFFMHPEEMLENLESALRGARLEQGELEGIVAEFYGSGVQVIGAEVEDFVRLLMDAR